MPLFLFILIAPALFGQKQASILLPDSLKKAADTVIAQWYIKEGKMYIYSHRKDLQKAYQYAAKALDFSRSISCNECGAKALALTACIYEEEGRNNEALLLCMQILDQYAETCPRIKNSVYFVMANVFENINAFEEVIKYQQLICEQSKKERDYKYLFYSLNRLTDSYDRTKQYALALACSREAMTVADFLHDNWVNTHKYNNMGFAFMNLSNPDSALYYFHLAEKAAVIDIQKNGHDSILWGSIQRNIGNIYKLKGNYSEALTLFQKGFNISRKNMDTLAFIDAGYDMANVMLHAKRYEDCRHLLDSLIFFCSLNPSYHSLLRPAYKIYSDVFLAQNKLKEALFYATRHIQLTDSLDKEEKNRYEKIMGTIARHDLELIKTQAEKIKQDRIITQQNIQNTRLKLILFVLASLIVLLLVSAWYLKRLNDQKKSMQLQSLQQELISIELKNTTIELKNKELEAKNTALENESLKEEMEYKKRDLTDFAINLSQQQDFINEMLNRLKDVNKAGEGRLKIELKELTRQLNGYLNINDKVTIFKEKVEKINSDFFNRLSQAFPTLTPGEKELCGLLRLQLSNKEIAIIKNISPDSAKVERYRLRKKLNLSPDEDVSNYLAAL